MTTTKIELVKGGYIIDPTTGKATQVRRAVIVDATVDADSGCMWFSFAGRIFYAMELGLDYIILS